MEYRTRSGIVLTSIGNQLVLVSAASLHDTIPYVTAVNDTTAFCWEALSKGVTEEQLIELVLDEFDAQDENTVRSEIADLVQQLYSKGYIIGGEEHV